MKNCWYLNSYYHSLADIKHSLLYSQFTNFVRKWSTLVTPGKWMVFSRLLSFVPVAISWLHIFDLWKDVFVFHEIRYDNLGVEGNCRQIEKRGFRWVPLRVRRPNWETTSACKKRRKSKGFVWLRYQGDSGHIDMHNSFIIFPPIKFCVTERSQRIIVFQVIASAGAFLRCTCLRCLLSLHHDVVGICYRPHVATKYPFQLHS